VRAPATRRRHETPSAPAARPTNEAAAPPLISTSRHGAGDAPRTLRGRPSSLKGRCRDRCATQCRVVKGSGAFSRIYGGVLSA
jgi:hypothetical protein